MNESIINIDFIPEQIYVNFSPQSRSLTTNIYKVCVFTYLHEYIGFNKMA